MKRLDKLILGAFLGPFFLTFSVSLFVFLTQYLLKYIDDFVGKDLGFAVFSELIFYFSMNMVPNALPLAILISSLMTFGNLGEHFELTAIKSSGISLVRTLIPIFVVVVLIAIGLFYFNNIIVPKANLKAYSLLYDIQQKKPAFDIKEGTFYNGLQGYSIKVTQKFPDGKALKGIMIYNHTEGRGNTDVVVADSGYMYTFNNERYLALELFNGEDYNELPNQNSQGIPSKFVRNKFNKTKMVFSLAAFDLKRTQQELFASNKYMLNTRQLNYNVDSLRKEHKQIRKDLFKNVQPFFSFEFHPELKNSLNKDSLYEKVSKFHYTQQQKAMILNRAANQARSVKSFYESNGERLRHINREGNGFEIEKFRKYTQSLACIIMFLIGAPLGAIIRKGGLGIPIFIGIIFFIIYYVITMMGEKWSKESVVEVPYGMWLPVLTLLPIGIFFLNQARNDARLFETDVYRGYWDRLKRKFIRK